MVLADSSSDGNFTVGPDAALIVWSLLLVAVIALMVFLVVRRGRRAVAVSEGLVSTGWIRLTRGIVELVLALIVLGLGSVFVSLVVSPSGFSYNAGPVAIADGHVQITVEPAFESASFGADKGDTVTTRAKSYEDMFGSGAKPLVNDAVDAEVLVDDAPVGLWLVTLSTFALTWTLALGFLWSLRSVLVRAEVGQPFSSHSVRSLRLMAFAVGPGVLLVVLGRFVAGTMAVDAGGGHESIAWHVPWYALLAALVLLALSEVWRYGVSLQEDAEATV